MSELIKIDFILLFLLIPLSILFLLFNNVIVIGYVLALLTVAFFYGVLLIAVIVLFISAVDLLKNRNIVETIGIYIMCGIAIFMILFIIPNFVKSRKQACYSACKANMNNIATALEMYAEDNNKKYPLKLEKLEPEYMRQIPVCGSYDSGLTISDVLYNKLLFKKNQDLKSHYCYEVNGKLNDFTIWCYSPERVHCFEWIPPKGHWPQYSKSNGLLEIKK